MMGSIVFRFVLKTSLLTTFEADERVGKAESLLYTVLYTLLQGNQFSGPVAYLITILEDIQLWSFIWRQEYGFELLRMYVFYIG